MRRAPTTSTGPRLQLVPGGLLERSAGAGAPPAAAETGRLVAGEVAAVLAASTDEDLGTSSLALPLALSACMQRYGVGAEDLLGAMRLLRRAVLSVSGLDASAEPVPFVTGDPRTSALSLARYLHGLLARAASVADGEMDAVASSALASLRAS